MVIRLAAPLTRPIALVAVGAFGLVAACSFDPGGVGGDGGIGDSDGAIVDAAPGDGVPPPPDATPDALPIDGATCVSWAAVNVDPCDGALPAAAALTIGNGRSQYDTDTGQLTVPGGLTSAPPSALLDQTVAGPKARVVNLSAFTVVSGGTLAVIGSHPLIVVVHGDAAVAGTVTVAARLDTTSRARTPGPGGDDATVCTTGVGEAGKPSTGAGGGGGAGGGAFGDNGGDGGDGQGGGHGGKGSKGTKNNDPDLSPLRGGCGGGHGGNDGTSNIDTGGAPGTGGGAVEITALGTITITGTIDAGGVGGAAAQLANAGGGGGGSGGAILLDGDTAAVAASAALCANGGGGGEGGQAVELADDGDNAACSTTRAAGGSLIGDGGDGGDGGALSPTTGGNGATGASGGGGGAGGGGVGRIRIRGRGARMVDGAATVSPAPTS